MKIIAIDDEGKEINLPPADDVADFIKVNRKRLRMSLQDIAKVVGVKRQAVWSWEKGVTIPSVENLVGLVKAFETAPDAMRRGIRTPRSAKVQKDMNRNLKLAEEILGA